MMIPVYRESRDTGMVLRGFCVAFGEVFLRFLSGHLLAMHSDMNRS